MIGVLFIGYLIYKKTTFFQKQEGKNMIKILDRIAIAPKKSLLITKVCDEKFLIALDSDRTTFLAKLNFEETIPSKEETTKPKITTDTMPDTKNPTSTDIQKQFMELYNKEENKDIFSERKEMIRQILEELNSDDIKTGSY